MLEQLFGRIWDSLLALPYYLMGEYDFTNLSQVAMKIRKLCVITILLSLRDIPLVKHSCPHFHIELACGEPLRRFDHIGLPTPT
jgi:hypothetical protein